MIERTTIDGKTAMVSYLKGEMEPATKEDHTYVKVIFDDGTVVFATPAKDKETSDVKDAV